MRHLIEQQYKSTTALMGKISAIFELETLATVGLFIGTKINRLEELFTFDKQRTFLQHFGI